MTAQTPHVLLNECEALDFDGLHLRNVLLCDPDAPRQWGDLYRARAQATPDRRFLCSALWAGYRCVYRVDADARISLVAFDYPFHEGRPADIVNEAMPGDFWLCMSERFGGPGAYVPVKDGQVQPREHWLFELEHGHRYVLGRDLKPGEWPPPLPSRHELAERSQTCSLLVRAVGGLLLAEHKLYVDHNIARTPSYLADHAPANAVYVRLSAGSHTVTLREWDPEKPNRMESATVGFDLDSGEGVEIVASQAEGRLCLEFASRV